MCLLMYLAKPSSLLQGDGPHMYVWSHRDENSASASLSVTGRVPSFFSHTKLSKSLDEHRPRKRPNPRHDNQHNSADSQRTDNRRINKTNQPSILPVFHAARAGIQSHRNCIQSNRVEPYQFDCLGRKNASEQEPATVLVVHSRTRHKPDRSSGYIICTIVITSRTTTRTRISLRHSPTTPNHCQLQDDDNNNNAANQSRKQPQDAVDGRDGLAHDCDCRL